MTKPSLQGAEVLFPWRLWLLSCPAVQWRGRAPRGPFQAPVSCACLVPAPLSVRAECGRRVHTRCSPWGSGLQGAPAVHGGRGRRPVLPDQSPVQLEGNRRKEDGPPWSSLPHAAGVEVDLERNQLLNNIVGCQERLSLPLVSKTFKLFPP